MNFELFHYFLKDFLNNYNFRVNFQINEFTTYNNGTIVKMYLMTQPDKDKMLYDISEKLHQECCINFNMIYMGINRKKPGIIEIEIK